MKTINLFSKKRQKIIGSPRAEREQMEGLGGMEVQGEARVSRWWALI